MTDLQISEIFLVGILQIIWIAWIDLLMPGGNKKITHTSTNLQLKAAGLFKYAWPFCYYQALKG